MSRRFVARNQRERILAAVAEATSALGYGRASVEEVIARAGVSRRTFYDLFKNKEEAFLAAYDEGAHRLFHCVREATASQEGPAGRVAAGLGAFLELLAASPAFARMCIVEVLAAGSEAVRRRNDAMVEFAAVIHENARELLGPGVPPPLATETFVGGVYEAVYIRIARNETAQLPELLPDLLHLTLLPYLGEEEAAAARKTVSGGAGGAGDQAVRG